MMTKILVVDDNILNIKLIKASITSSDYKIITAVNGAEGIEIAKQEIPDLILMDIQMPKMNGIDAMKEIKRTEGLGNIPVIAYTAFAMKGDKERLMGEGFDDYLEKPVVISNIVELVNKYTDE